MGPTWGPLGTTGPRGPHVDPMNFANSGLSSSKASPSIWTSVLNTSRKHKETLLWHTSSGSYILLLTALGSMHHWWKHFRLFHLITTRYDIIVYDAFRYSFKYSDIDLPLSIDFLSLLTNEFNILWEPHLKCMLYESISLFHWLFNTSFYLILL